MVAANVFCFYAIHPTEIGPRLRGVPLYEDRRYKAVTKKRLAANQIIKKKPKKVNDKTSTVFRALDWHFIRCSVTVFVVVYF